MLKRPSHQFILSLALIVIVIEAVMDYLNIKSQERQLLLSTVQGADQLSKGSTRATRRARTLRMLNHGERNTYGFQCSPIEKSAEDPIVVTNRIFPIWYWILRHAGEAESGHSRGIL